VRQRKQRAHDDHDKHDHNDDKFSHESTQCRASCA
jgi:hypothetical protein